MCNLYTLRKGPAAILDLARAMTSHVGNLEPVDIYPDYAAPIVRQSANGGRELARARWGMPTPPKFLQGKKTDPGVTNTRNVISPHWRRWLGVESRCNVPATAFSECGQERDPVTKRLKLHWFAIDGEQPLFFFAGIWTRWRSVPKVNGGGGSHRPPLPVRSTSFAGQRRAFLPTLLCPPQMARLAYFSELRPSSCCQHHWNS